MSRNIGGHGAVSQLLSFITKAQYGVYKKVFLRTFSIQFKQKKFIVNYKYTAKKGDIFFFKSENESP